MPKEAGLNKQGSHFSSQDTFTHFVPVNINLPSSHQSQRTPQGFVTKDGYEGLKYQLASQGGQPILTSEDKISLVFKTRKSSALLYYNGKLSSP